MFYTMKIFYSSFLYQFIFIQITSTKQPEIINFDVLSESNEEISVSLVLTETFLANENIPVWIQVDKNAKKLTRRNDVMEKLTPFTVYRDPHICAAAIYFQKKKEFEGTIGHHHFIRKLPYNSATKNVEPSEYSIFTSSLPKHSENRLGQSNKNIMKKAGTSKKNWNRSHKKCPNVVYVETLVMINHDITQDLKYDFAAVVTYVLTLFNTVDMLFSTIKIPIIKINIAGIIIATSHLSFPQIITNSCYETNARDKRVFEMDTDCSFDAIISTLNSYKAVPLQSYDIVIFLTRSRIFHYQQTPSRKEFHRSKVLLAGRANNMQVDSNGYRQSSKDTKIAIISDPENLKFFPTVAHEIAHLLGVPHDGGVLWKEDGTCDAHLMKKDRSMCRKCLKFGGRTPEYLKMFFSSRDGCIFHNEPRSLYNPPGPQLFWNAHEQCRCYGHKTFHRPKKIFHLFSSAVNCKIRLQCLDWNNQIHDTSIYMDGTPCDKNENGDKVCWNSRCVAAKVKMMKTKRRVKHKKFRC